ncbi:MAG: FHA domain-containing protein, partial [Planctomycetales bacterium]|nr:FHA domain-containing protein [Planctomycetales bacterium]
MQQFMPYLEVINGPSPGVRHELIGGNIVLGRHPDCDVVIDVGAVSRQHARIVRAGASFLVEDLKSRNGTLLNEEPVSGQIRLASGDRLQVCDVTLVFHDDRPEFAPLGGNAPSHDSSYGALLVDDEPGAAATIMGTVDVGTLGGSLQIGASAEAKLQALLEINRHLGRRLALDEV